MSLNFDIFFSICQTEVDGFMPNERQMLLNFFDQVKLADQLGFGCAWVAETHLSCQVQKENPFAVIPHFKGEIGLNTDILQLSHLVFEQTERIHMGSAICNIICNGGPIAHAERLKTFLTFHSLRESEKRKLEFGFAAGRFPFSNIPYGFRPRNLVEQAAWPVLKGRIFHQATEIFLRLLKKEIFSIKDVRPMVIEEKDFRSAADWHKVVEAYQAERGGTPERIAIDSIWHFDKVGVIPFEAPMDNLRLTIGSHDPKAQILANEFLPVGVFNLSITPSSEIDETHDRMKKHFHPDGGEWSRRYMPRTVLVFIDTEGKSESERNENAERKAKKALATYWQAIEGTLDQSRVDRAVDNALIGSPERIISQIKERFHPQDRLMLWFDLSNHDSESVKKSMRNFMECVAPNV